MAENTNTTVAVAEEKKEVAKQTTNKITDYSLGIFGTSDNFVMAMQMAKGLSGSTLVPREYQGNECNCLIAVDIAIRLNTSPFVVMQNLDVIQGRPSWRSQALIGMINASKRYDMELQFEETKDKNGKPFSCQCWTTRKGRRVDGPVVDMDMAIAEKWVEKNGSKWKTMPQVMLRYRAAAFFSRMNCPEISMGLYTNDEVVDGDFKEYPLEDMQEQVQREIAQNANSQDFEESVTEPQSEEQELPPFMTAE